MNHPDKKKRCFNCPAGGVLLLMFALVLSACSSNSTPPELRGDDESYAYKRQDNPYSDVLQQCVLVGTVAGSCTVETLPFIGQQGTIDRMAIMDRVLVTHDWMGQRFEEMLNQFPDDLIPLFGSVTAIYIGSYIRPSYYSTLNGAIHLDPDFLWLSRQEKATVSQEQDPRADFGADLQFDSFRRFVRGQNYAWRYFSLSDDSEREHADIRISLARLLYHELAHANDFLPYTVRSNLDSSLKVIDAIDSVRDSWVSSALSADQPLNSEALKGLAQVRYRNLTPTDDEKATDAAYAGSLMQNDGANYFYGYFTIREDLAGLFEAAMLKANYDIDMDFAFVTKPQNSNPVCEDYLVGWGVRGRLGNPQVASRTAFIANRILTNPEPVESMLQAQSMQEQLMRPGDDWCQNRFLNDVPAATQNRSQTNTIEFMNIRESDGRL